MSGVMHEPRTAVMLVAEAKWKDTEGALQTASARVEDRSPGGACLRLGKPVVVGTRLVIQTRREHFSGSARYCRSDGRDYVVGIQRDKVMVPIMKETPSNLSDPDGVKDRALPAEPSRQLTVPASAIVETVPPQPEGDRKAADSVVTPPESNENHPAKAKANKLDKARKPMRNKLLELAHWCSKPDAPVGNCNGEENQQEASHPSDASAAHTPVVTATNCEAELLPIEEIYRTAGIMNVRHGIHRVVEMMGSEHLRGLSKDMKRAAVLMALDAAGIPIDQVLQDCKVRQTALDAYEAGQKKQVEAQWARKAEENIQIQAELERVKAHYMARIARNLESVEREKATFSNWLTKKRQESQSISEAADLFAQSPVAETATAAAAANS